ncbi:hypothetical protein [Sphingobacterium sp. UBA5789]|uniref:hypothetical protein n=2 Tax=unclassified Sphingobacterium TaxID=2609468 RepID=UPI0025D00C90|nr:hypothetical protein [Sphingobacterium sp. UBA5789]
MTKMQIENKLFLMVGKTYMYMNKNMKVLRYEISDEETRIITDARDIRFSNDNARLKLDEFLEVEDEPAMPVVYEDHLPGQVQNVVLPDLLINKQDSDLIQLAKRNIELIMQDEGDEIRIKKAAAVNDQLKSIIDICKIEVEGMKVAAYVHKVHN